jgi:hypothetical protein
MKKISIIFFLFVIVLNTSIFAEIWSPYMGRMDWDDARAKCRSIGMRLPTLQELKAAYNAGITESWKNDAIDYWSSTPYDAQMYYTLIVYDGITHLGASTRYSHVRCRR